MKIYILLITILFSSFSFASKVPITIEEVTEKVSKQNFLVLENAERVYQKKENIKFARANLLPKLNLWNIVKVAADWLSVLDVVQDIAPFLVPANWFKAKQSKYVYRAQKEQYRALWANEVNTAKLLFLGIVRDEKLLQLLESKVTRYKEIMEMARSRNIFGGEDVFSYNLIRDRYLALLEDERLVRNMVFNEKKEFQYIAGINNEEEISLVAPALPDVADSKPIEFSKVIFKVMEASPEVAQFEHLANSLSQVKGQIYFNVLGVSSFSAGQGGGTFDNIPIQDGLGFGLGASVRIAKSEGRILKIQIKATIETLKKEVNLLVNEYNSLISNYDIASERISLSQQNFQNMMSYLSLGGKISALEMMEILDNLYSSHLVLLAYQYRFASLVEKLKRMTFSDDYLAGPSLVIGGKK
jgi:outer membrane protein TolC